MPMPFTPSPNDGAIDLLRAVFGKVIDNLVGGNTHAAAAATANMLGEAFRFFNSGVLFFGTIILLWVTLFGVANTANDGEALGKRWSTFYTPLRTLTAASTLIPTASGYAGVQIILLMIVIYSIGFASNLFSAVVNFSVGQDVVQQAAKSITDDPHFEELVTDALRMKVCAAGVNRSINSTMGSGNPVYLQLQRKDYDYPGVYGKTLQSRTYKTYIYYQDPAWPASKNICGQIALTSTFDAPGTTSNTTAIAARSVAEAISNIRFRYTTALFETGSLNDQITDQIVKIVDTGQGTIDSEQVAVAIAQMKKSLMADITSEVTRQLSTENSDIAKKLSEKGWIYAGSLYMELTRIKDAVRAATTSKSEFIPGTYNLDSVLTGDMAQAAGSILATYNTISSEIAKKALVRQNEIAASALKPPVIKTNFTAEDFTDGGSSVKTMITTWTNGASTSILNGTVHYLSAEVVNPQTGEIRNEDPVMRVKNLGDWLSTSALSLIVARTAISSSLDGVLKGMETMSNQPIGGIPFSISSGVVKAISSLIANTWSTISMGVYTILYAGYYLGIWVPMIPFFIYAIGVVGWLIFVGEMLAAGVLWMAAHVTPAQNDSFIGSQAQGYLLVMSGFFRPALMVLGFVFSIAALSPAVQYINEGFILAVRSNQADSVTGIFSLAGYMLCYCFLISAVFMTIFALPQTFPDRILKWIGAGIGDMGEQGSMSRLENSASSQAQKAAVAGAAKYAADQKAKQNADGKGADKEADIAAQAAAAAPEGISGSSTAFAPGEGAAGSSSSGGGSVGSADHASGSGGPPEGISGHSAGHDTLGPEAEI